MLSAGPRPGSVGRWRATALGLALACAGLLALVLVLWSERRGAPPPPDGPEEVEVEDRLELRPASFDDLPGWSGDLQSEALPAFASSCRALARRAPESFLGEGEVARRVGDWQAFCHRLEAVAPGEPERFRRLLEEELEPFALTNRGDAVGLFTGYYEPTLRGSRRPSERFPVPLYLKPPDLVSVDLGRFREDLDGRRIAGRLAGGALEPYFDRAEIDAGGLGGRGLELVYVDDAVDAFFLHIQGSGRVELEGGGFVRVGYAGQNGHPYFAIGRDLVERGALSREEVSMQSIRRWLAENAEEARAVMHRNRSYVFFRELEESGPVGSLGVVLTPHRSAAVDRKFLPLGVPLWISTTTPALDPAVLGRPLRRLMVAQDTGGAIRGPVRADLFFGPGREAAEVAGRMRQEGRMWVMLPRAGRVGQ